MEHSTSAHATQMPVDALLDTFATASVNAWISGQSEASVQEQSEVRHAIRQLFVKVASEDITPPGETPSLSDLLSHYGHCRIVASKLRTPDGGSSEAVKYTEAEDASRKAKAAILAFVASLEADKARLEKEVATFRQTCEPDYCWEVNDTEHGAEWFDYASLCDDLGVGEYMHVLTGFNGPDRWLVRIATQLDEDGTPVDDEVVDFSSEAEAIEATSPPPGGAR